MKGSDYVAKFLREKTDFVFGLQGGAVVHLFDSFERIGPKPIYCHHEQAAGFAAAGYARTHGFGVCVTTTGPGATNAITPLLGAWQDSLPVLFISGQTRSQNVSYNTKVRQIGTQEAPICHVAAPIAKVALYINDPMALYQGLPWAYEESIKGRPGPVWIDIPLDVQYSELPNS